MTADHAQVGVIITARLADVIHLVDIALLPAAQGAGVGSEVLRRLLAEADADGWPVSLNVDPMNTGARALYARLGFVEQDASLTMVAMQRRAGGRGESGRDQGSGR